MQFVPDVTPYEHMKIRILNGGHAIIAYPAGLLDVHFVHEAMQTDLVARFLEKIETEEILPIVPPVPDTDLGAYFQLIKRRFANPKIGDTIRRLCLDGSNRQPKFIVPSVLDNLQAGREPTRPCARKRAVVPLLPGRDRFRRRDRAERSELGPAGGAGEGGRDKPGRGCR